MTNNMVKTFPKFKRIAGILIGAEKVVYLVTGVVEVMI